MSCIDPIHIRNRKYMPNKANGGIVPECPDPRLKIIDVPCGKCIECRRRRASDWRFRMLNEYKYSDHKRFHFVTFTFARDKIDFLFQKHNCHGDYNTMVKRAVRAFLERYRKAYGVSLRHLFVTEFGDSDEHIHIHGIIIDCKCGVWKRGRYYADFEKLTALWSYGHIWLGWCNERSISYVLKYIMKYDPKRPNYKPLLLVSPGLGRAYCDSVVVRDWHNTGEGNFYAVTSSGYKIGLPRYYRLKLFSEDFLAKRTLRLLDEPPKLFFRGRKFDNLENYTMFVLRYFQETLRLGLSFSKFRVQISENEEFNLN